MDSDKNNRICIDRLQIHISISYETKEAAITRFVRRTYGLALAARRIDPFMDTTIY